MRKIVKGKIYDTDTAKHLGRYTWYDSNVSHWQVEDIYLKKTGEFFMEENVCDPERGGKIYAITPIKIEYAKNVLEKVLRVEEYEILFGKIEE